jgi:acetyl-CoA C-acetyltransferase
VVFGNVIQADVGPNPARLSAVAGGIPMSVPAVTVKRTQPCCVPEGCGV